MRAGVLITAVVVLGGCVAGAPRSSAVPTGSGAIATPAPSTSGSTSPALTNVRLARAGGHVVILANGKAVLDNGDPMNIRGQGLPAEPVYRSAHVNQRQQTRLRGRARFAFHYRARLHG